MATDRCSNCAIEQLLATALPQWSANDQRRLIALGRPTPNLRSLFEVAAAAADHNLYEKFTWLAGCCRTQAVYCWPCLLFAAKSVRHPFIDGYTRFDGLQAAISAHELTTFHFQACLRLKICGKQLFAAQPSQVPDQRRLQLLAHRNRQIVIELVRATIYLVTNGIAFNVERSPATAHHTYVELLKLLTEHNNATLCHRLVGRDDRRFRPASQYIHAELLESIAAAILLHIQTEIHNAPFVSVILNECEVEGGRIEVTIALRYAAHTFQARELVVAYIDVTTDDDNRRIDDMFGIVMDVLRAYDCAGRFVAYSYFGTAINSERLTGLRAKMKSAFPNCAFVRYGYDFGAVITNAMSRKIKRLAKFFATIDSIDSFIWANSQRRQIVQMNWQGQGTAAAAAVPVLKVNACKQMLIHIFNDITVEKTNAAADISLAETLNNSLQTIEFIFSLLVFGELFPIFQDAYRQLLCGGQRSATVAINNIVDRAIKRTIAYKTDANFDKFFAEAVRFCYEDNSFRDAARTISNPTVKLSLQREYHEIVDILADEFGALLCWDNLTFFKLLQPANFAEFAQSGVQPADLFAGVQRICDKHIMVEKLKQQLKAIYAEAMVCEQLKTVADLLAFVKNHEMDEHFVELVKFVQLYITIPPGVDGDEIDGFQTFRRIKSRLKTAAASDGGAADELVEEMIKNLAIIETHRNVVDCMKATNVLDEMVLEEFAERTGIITIIAS